MTRVAMSEVISALSYGGEHSTTSRPASGRSATSWMNFSTSRGRNPPGSGHPVPGTNAASRQSTSKDSHTASAPPPSTPHARSARVLLPLLPAAGPPFYVVPPPAATVPPGRWPLPAADPDLHQVLGWNV